MAAGVIEAVGGPGGLLLLLIGTLAMRQSTGLARRFKRKRIGRERGPDQKHEREKEIDCAKHQGKFTWGREACQRPGAAREHYHEIML